MANLKSVTMKYGAMFVETLIGQMMMQVSYVENWDLYLKVKSVSILRFVSLLCCAGAKGSNEFKSLITFPFFLSGPNCSGSEQRLIDCPGSEIGNSTSCSYTSVVHCAGIHNVRLLSRLNVCN